MRGLPYDKGSRVVGVGVADLSFGKQWGLGSQASL